MKSIICILLPGLLVSGNLAGWTLPLGVLSPLADSRSTERRTAWKRMPAKNKIANHPLQNIPLKRNRQAGKPPGKPHPVTLTFKSVAALLTEYSAARSIEIRVNKPADYDAAVLFYNAQFAALHVTDIKADASTRSFAYPATAATKEFVVVNTAGMPNAKPKTGTVGYINWASISNRPDMDKAYASVLALGSYGASEPPGQGSVGARDGGKNTVRAILQKNKSLFVAAGYEGVIINPPVP